jgi:membrane-associated protease RseP (regulator of RpoE activity)
MLAGTAPGTLDAADGVVARLPTAGTLGYGPPGVFPGFQGFGLGYHLGYGYGGAALGTGAEGGYPFYGGPGYPCLEPRLQRLHRITPFPYFGGPGYPTPDHPNFFGVVGPLQADKPVITIGDDRYDVGFGMFTGAIPYPESVMAPFTTSAAAGGSASGVITLTPSPSPPPTNPVPVAGATTGSDAAAQLLGVDVVPVVDPGGVRGTKITRIDPNSAAEKAGLHTGDVIHSVNGYVTADAATLGWVIVNAGVDKVQTMTVRSASDGKEHPIRVQLP